MLGMPCKYNPIEHRILGGGFIKRVRSCVPDGRQLFLYFHIHTRNYVVALWNRKHRDFFDVVNIGPALMEFSQDNMNMLRASMHRAASVAKHQEIQRMKDETKDALYADNDKEGVRGGEFKRRMSSRIFVGQMGG